MSGLEIVLLVCAGLGGGLAGSIAGLASLVIDPALIGLAGLALAVKLGFDAYG